MPWRTFVQGRKMSLRFSPGFAVQHTAELVVLPVAVGRNRNVRLGTIPSF